MVPAPQSMRVLGPELVAPAADRLTDDRDPSPSQEVLNVPVAQVEEVVEPDRVLDDLRGESVAFVSSDRAFHLRMVARRRLTWHYPTNETNVTDRWSLVIECLLDGGAYGLASS
jgi:hypothetical protein